VPPSGFTLTGLVQHLAEVERNWFRRVLAGEQARPIYDPQADPRGPDGGFDVAEGATLRSALTTWHAEVARAEAGQAEAEPARRQLCWGDGISRGGREWPTAALSLPAGGTS
jgi:Protein of unknown function (DUF664)